MAWFKCAEHLPISNNTGGQRTQPNIGLILHHAVADGSLFSFFNNPANQVSAHFWVAKDGTIEQYVDTDVIAWHGIQLNANYCGVETEGCVAPPHAEPLTPAQLSSLSTLYAEGMAVHNWPKILANEAFNPGFGYHRMPGGVNTACPCDVRVNARQSILDSINPTPTPPNPQPTPPMEDLVPLTSMLDKDGNITVFGVDPSGNLWEVTTKDPVPGKTYRWSNITANGANGQKLATS